MYFFSKNTKNITIFHLKIIIFAAMKNCSVLHGRLCVMVLFTANSTCKSFVEYESCLKNTKTAFVQIVYISRVALPSLSRSEKLVKLSGNIYRRECRFFYDTCQTCSYQINSENRIKNENCSTTCNKFLYFS